MKSRERKALLKANGPFEARAADAPYRVWGADHDFKALEQMKNACALPVAAAGALMPDAHVGYGLPICGVLATENAVIPYAVGVDIACRMKLSVFQSKANVIGGIRDRLTNIVAEETRFGVGSEFRQHRDHEVMEKDWSVSPITQRFRDKAWAQLGTSGSGNHFVEFGSFTVTDQQLGLAPGEYMALLSHSGSRGTGAQVCQHYSRLAMKRHGELSKEL